MRSALHTLAMGAALTAIHPLSFIGHMGAAGVAATAEATLRAAMRQNALTIHHYRAFHRRHSRFMRDMFNTQYVSLRRLGVSRDPFDF